jgi:LacI family transcriptional regulator
MVERGVEGGAQIIRVDDRGQEALGFAPSAIAQGLKKGRTHLLALIVADVANPFFTNLIHAVEAVAADRGYSIVLGNSDETFEKERNCLRRIRAQRCDGLILAPTGEPEAYAMSDLGYLTIPIVMVDRVIESLAADSVTLDNFSAAFQATKYILDLGHRRIASIAGPSHVSTGGDRLAGFKRALTSHGIAPDPSYIRSGGYREDLAFSATRELLALPEPPTAIYVANNLMLIGVMRALNDAGLACPADISIVSTDDFSWSTAFRPRLTTVSQPVTDMAVEAVRLLVDRIGRGSTEPPRRLVLQPTLIVRESCAPLR